MNSYELFLIETGRKKVEDEEKQVEIAETEQPKKESFLRKTARFVLPSFLEKRILPSLPEKKEEAPKKHYLSSYEQFLIETGRMKAEPEKKEEEIPKKHYLPSYERFLTETERKKETDLIEIKPEPITKTKPDIATLTLPEIIEEGKLKDIWDAFYLTSKSMLHKTRQYFTTTLPSLLIKDVKVGEKRIDPIKREIVNIETEEQAAEINKFYQKKREELITKYEKNEQRFRDWLAKNPQLQPRPEWQKSIFENIKENPSVLKDPAYYGYIIAETIPFTIGIMGVAATTLLTTKNPLLATSSGFVAATPVVSQDLYEDLIRNGATREQAQKITAIIGPAIAAVEVISDFPILKMLGVGVFVKQLRKEAQKEVVKLCTKKLIGKGIKTFLTIEAIETMEEVAQEAIQNAAVKTVNKTRSLFENIPEVAIRSLIGISPIALFGGATQVRQTYREMGGTISPKVSPKTEIKPETEPKIEIKPETEVEGLVLEKVEPIEIPPIRGIKGVEEEIEEEEKKEVEKPQEEIEIITRKSPTSIRDFGNNIGIVKNRPEIYTDSHILLLDRKQEEVNKWRKEIEKRGGMKIEHDYDTVKELFPKDTEKGIYLPEPFLYKGKENQAHFDIGEEESIILNAEAYKWLKKEGYEIKFFERDNPLVLERNNKIAGLIAPIKPMKGAGVKVPRSVPKIAPEPQKAPLERVIKKGEIITLKNKISGVERRVRIIENQPEKFIASFVEGVAKDLPMSYSKQKWEILEPQAVSGRIEVKPQVEPEAKPEPKLKTPKPVGDIEKKILGGGLDLEIQKRVKETSIFRRILEKVIPSLRRGRLEAKVGREIMEDLPKDINPIVAQLLRPLMPQRVYFRINPLASEIVANSVKTNLQIETEKEAAMGKIYDIESSFVKGFPKRFFKRMISELDYERLADYQEMGLTDEQVAQLPSPYKEALTELRKLARTRLDLIVKDLGIDVSNWRFTPENYLHHMWRGNWELFSEKENKRIGIGTRKEMFDMFEKYLDLHPDSDVVIRPRVVQANFDTIQLSQKGFWAFVSRLAKTMEMSAEDVLDDLSFKGVIAIKRKRVFVGAFKPRLTNLGGYIKDPFTVERTLWAKLIKKKYLEPWSKWARIRLNKLPPQMRVDMENYIRTVETQGFLEPSIWYFNQLVNRIVGAQANLKLGYRWTTSAAINRLQDIQFTLPEVGWKNWIRGKLLAHTPEGKRLIAKSNILVAPVKYEMGEFRQTRKIPWWKPLGMFNKAELAVRAESFLESFVRALRRFDYHEVNKVREKYNLEKYNNQEDMAIDFAIRSVMNDMGIYNLTDFPTAWRHPLGRLIFQFRFIQLNWLVKAKDITLGKPPAGLEIFYESKPYTKAEKLSRVFNFWMINITMAGIRAFRTILGVVSPALLALLLLRHPKMSAGIFGLLGVDISKTASTDSFELLELVQKPMADSFGVNVSDVKKIMDAYQKREPMLVLGIMPQLQRVVEAIIMDDGVKINWYTDIPQAKLSFWERVAYGVGLTPLKLTVARDLSVITKQIKDGYNETKRRFGESLDVKDFQKAGSLVREHNTYMKKLLPLVVKQSQYVLGRELTEEEKIKVLQPLVIEEKDIITWVTEWAEDKYLDPYMIEKQLRIK